MIPAASEPPASSLDSFYKLAHHDIAAWGTASIASSILLIATYGALPDVRRTPGWQFLYSSICEIFVSGGFVILSSIEHGDADRSTALPDIEHLVCAEYKPLLGSVLAFDAAANSWRLLMYVDLIVVYHNPFRPNTARPLYHVVVAAVASLWALAVSHTTVLCSADSANATDDASQPAVMRDGVNVFTLTWGLVYAPFLLFVVLGSTLSLAVQATHLAPQYPRSHAASGSMAVGFPDRCELTSRTPSRRRYSREMNQAAPSSLASPGSASCSIACCISACISGNETNPASGPALFARPYTRPCRYGVLLGLLAVGYANFQLLSATEHPSLRGVFIRVTAALTAGRPVFGFLGWSRAAADSGDRRHAQPEPRPKLAPPRCRSLINRVPQRAIRRQPSVEGGDARASGHHHSRSASLTGGVHGNLTGRSLLRALQQPLLATEAIDGSGGGGGCGGSDKSAAVAGDVERAEPPSGDAADWLARRPRPAPARDAPLIQTDGGEGDFGAIPNASCSFSGGASGAALPTVDAGVDYRASLEPEAEESWVAISQGVREAGFKAELRYELVADVALSISSLAEAEAQEPPVQQRLPPPAAGTAASSTLTPGTPPLSRNGVGATGGDTPTTPVRGDPAAGAVPGSPLCSPWMQRNSPAGVFYGAGGRLAPERVQHYAVAHFRAIREAFGISPKSFAAAFASSLADLSARRRLRESVSEGASGSFFYWVKNADGSDTGFIVKQITKAEKDVLMHILPAYKAHVQARRGASLLQYLSCHAMRLRWKWSGKVYFVVMRNFFPARPQHSFDLKGATANRRALKTWELHQTNTVAGRYGTLRDWEWMDIGMTTDLLEVDKAYLWAMIRADCRFLQTQHLLDYSLLLGIHRPLESLPPQHKAAELQRLARQCRGTAVVSRDRQKVRASPGPRASRLPRPTVHMGAHGRRCTFLGSLTFSNAFHCGGGCSGWCYGSCTVQSGARPGLVCAPE